MKIARQNRRAATILLLLGILELLSMPPAMAGNFAVSPIRLDFDTRAKNGSITITNDADADLKVQISLNEWIQDENGKDLYRPTDDLLYFPRLAVISPKSKQIVRVGSRGPGSTVTHEKSYRLFVEELPERKQLTGSKLAMAVRFGIPLFVKPSQEEPSGEITQLHMEKGQLHVVVHNSGNIHFKIASVSATAGDRYSVEAGGWYLLPAASREYQFAVPTEACSRLNKIDVVIRTDRLQLQGALDVTSSMCNGN